jgi:hypothetical protein
MQAVTADSHISFLQTSPVGVAKVWLAKNVANSGASEPMRMAQRLLIMIGILSRRSGKALHLIRTRTLPDRTIIPLIRPSTCGAARRGWTGDAQKQKRDQCRCEYSHHLGRT